jgi:hypothetical protein
MLDTDGPGQGDGPRSKKLKPTMTRTVAPGTSWGTAGSPGLSRVDFMSRSPTGDGSPQPWNRALSQSALSGETPSK